MMKQPLSPFSGRTIICAAAILTMAAACVGCKGRRASDEVIPNGDTVEVVVNIPVDTLQSISQENEI